MVAVLHAAGSHVGFQADDGFDAGGLGGVVKFDHTEHGAVIGQRQGGHTQIRGMLDHLFQIGEAVKQGILRVDMQMGERHIGKIIALRGSENGKF